MEVNADVDDGMRWDGDGEEEGGVFSFDIFCVRYETGFSLFFYCCFPPPDYRVQLLFNIREILLLFSLLKCCCFASRLLI